MNIIGDVKGKKAILIDDMIDTAGTICNAAQALLEKGAVEVYACATHAIFSGPALERLKNSAFTILLSSKSATSEPVTLNLIPIVLPPIKVLL